MVDKKMKIKTINPATEEILAEYNIISKKEALTIAEKVHRAQQSWGELPLKERLAHIGNVGKVLRRHVDRYAEVMTQEMGKVIKESKAEVEKCAWLCDVMVEKAETWLADETVEADGKKHIITHEPLGSIYIIMPWNYPFWQVFKVGIPILTAGNTLLLKHARNVTGSSLAIESIFKEAGLPNSVFRSLVIDHETSDTLIESEYVQACSVTGSVDTGARVAERAGKQIKKTVLELGGSDPFIVLEDADIEAAAKGAVLGRTSNAGQVCIGAKRMIVVKDVAEDFKKEFSERMKDLVVGDPMKAETNVGPLVDEKAVKAMEIFVDDAVKRGASVVVGGKKPGGKGFFFEPTVLDQTTMKMKAVCQETFGPIAPLIVVADEEEAISVANDTEFGLNASVWTKDLTRGEQVARRIKAGGVFVNSFSKSHPYLPLGGIKKSGYGRELSHVGIKEFTNVKPINLYET